MKKAFICLLFLLQLLAATAQVNVQIHYDFGRTLYPDSESDRQKITATLEQFHPDRLGSIYYFVDFDFYSKGMKGAYLEFSREFNVCRCLAAHIEYNGGMTTGHLSEYGSQFQHAMLIGPACNLVSADFRRTLSFQLLYKQYFRGNDNKAYPSVQFTTVWGLRFGKNDMLTFSGYADFWRSRTPVGKIRLTASTEPQIWLNLDAFNGLKGSGLSIGSECEMSYNFIFPVSGHKKFFCNPTLAVKWTM